MKKQIASILLTVMMIVTLLPLGLMDTAWAATVVDSGSCGKNGDNVTWKLTSEGTLTISGTGIWRTLIIGTEMVRRGFESVYRRKKSSFRTA